MKIGAVFQLELCLFHLLGFFMVSWRFVGKCPFESERRFLHRVVRTAKFIYVEDFITVAVDVRPCGQKALSKYQKFMWHLTDYLRESR